MGVQRGAIEPRRVQWGMQGQEVLHLEAFWIEKCGRLHVGLIWTPSGGEHVVLSCDAPYDGVCGGG